MNNVEELRDIRADHLKEIEFHKEKVVEITKKILDKMRKDKTSFEKIFNEWMDNATKRDYPWLENIVVNGKDIWDLYGDYTDRYKTYTIGELVEKVWDSNYSSSWSDAEITEEEAWEYCRLLMEKNVGSIVFDW